VHHQLQSLTLLIALSLASCGGRGGEEVDPSLIHTVGRRDLIITVRERGELKAARDTRITSELEGRATLIYLIPEGTIVEAGEKVAELDVSAIAEKRALQAINVARAEATLEQARKTVEIVEKELQAAAKTAETRLQIAQLRLEKFQGHQRTEGEADGEASAGTNGEMVDRLRELLGSVGSDSTNAARHPRLLERVLEVLGSEESLRLEMGEMANQILQQIDEISLARADLELATETLFHSRNLEQKGFITTTELERDEINHKRQLSKQTVAWNNLGLLVNYTLPEDLISLELEVENAGLDVESVQAANEARRVREDAELKSIEAEYALAVEQLANCDQQIQNGILRAPAAGLVVYGRYDWDEPVYEGMSVRERQEVIILPDVSTMKVELKVPEAQIGRVATEQTATIGVEAFPNESFTGRITHVATLPDPAPRSRVLKVYVTEVLVDGDNSQGRLRPGMNCTVTIEIGTLRDVLNVPLPALERRGDTHFVWKVTPEGPAAAEVELGGNNLTHVQIVAGLVEGERIYLVRPPGAELPPSAEEGPRESSPPVEAETARYQGGAPAAGL